MKRLIPKPSLISSIQFAGWASSIGVLAWGFLKIGVAFFGGGYGLIPVLHRQLVTNWGWLTSQEFLDGLAISTLTPGPIAILAVFVGFKRNGVIGAGVATVALFFPAFVFMYVASRLYKRVKDFEVSKAFLDGVLPAVVGLLLVAAIQLGTKTIHAAWGIAVAAVSLFLLIRFKVNPLWLLLVMAVGGWLLKLK